MNNPINIEWFLKLRWSLHEGNPIIDPPYYSPIIADPTVILPEESHDGKWQLYAHSILGIHRYTSKNGLDWERGRLQIVNAMRPFIFRREGIYNIFYEKYRSFQLPFSWVKFWKWDSRIEFSQSKDLYKWGKSIPVLEPRLTWHMGNYGKSVSNPCVVFNGKDYRLFYSAGLVEIPDCGFSEPEHLGIAFSEKIEGPYQLHPEPLLSPHPKNSKCNLAAGSFKVLALDHGYLGFQNGISLHEGVSTSEIYLHYSEDGLKWNYLMEEPILKPTEGWMGSHIYAFDVKLDKKHNRILLYFNARDKAHWTKGKEKIGLFIGSPQTSP